MTQIINHHRVQQPSHVAEFRRCLIDCDIGGILGIWALVEPNMPKPENDEQALVCIHMARTATESILFRYRAYSHRWLTERNKRSLLPDHLKPKADRLYPRIVSAVGICVSGLGNKKTDYHHHVSKALSDVVENFYADGDEDPGRITAAMKEVHDKLRKQK